MRKFAKTESQSQPETTNVLGDSGLKVGIRAPYTFAHPVQDTPPTRGFPRG